MDHFQIENSFLYWTIIIVSTLLMRLFFSLLRANEYKYYVPNRLAKHPEMENKIAFFSSINFAGRFRKIFCGFSKVEPYPDSWYNTAIGTFELYSFPILMSQNKFEYIGAWLAFKLIGQWKMWNENRNAANRIIIATALQLMLSYFFLMPCVFV